MDRIRHLLDDHRRLIAAACAALAVLAGLSSLRQAPRTQPVLVARHDLASGHVVTADDVRVASVPRGAAPDHVLRRRCLLYTSPSPRDCRKKKKPGGGDGVRLGQLHRSLI
ncbi:SAF domain-containing protein, partial [Aeromicrobium fastidiosum]|uniref:SAF domain-containing protein n=1 Tax=Aeromicrobium fastidiosum TaxID=52699 RepID=UPI0020231D70